MSLATTRATEKVGRGVEKHIIHKHIPGYHSYAACTTTSADASSYEDTHYMDSSSGWPDSSEGDRQGTGFLPVIAEDTVPEVPIPEPRPDIARQSISPSLALNLDMCPSFAEQRPQGTKPLFFDRHDSLQRVYQSHRSGASTTTTSTEPGAASTSCNSATSHTHLPACCLPSWDVARSELWMQAVLALQKIGPPGAAGADAETGRYPALPTTTTAPTSTRAASTSTPFACILTQASVTQQAGGLTGLFRSISCRCRACPATPRGMGPLPTMLTPSFTIASLTARSGAKSRSCRWAAAAEAPVPVLEPERESFVVPDPGRPEGVLEAGGAAEQVGVGHVQQQEEQHHRRHDNEDGGDVDADGDGDDGGLRHRRKHNAAFVAGLAAATSTAVAVSNLASVTSARLSGFLSQASPSGAASMMHLGSNLLSVGGSIFFGKIQGVIMNSSTMTAAEVVLGHDAPIEVREQLRERLRFALAGASVMWFLLNLHQTTDILTHLDFDHDFLASTKVVLNLASSGPGLIRNCQELLQIGVAVTMGVGKRVMGADGL